MALFDSLLKKVRYTANAVTRIGEAANAKGAAIILDTDPLDTWPDKIGAIKTSLGNLEISIAKPPVLGTVEMQKTGLDIVIAANN